MEQFVNDEEDEEIQRAIAASLGQERPPPPPSPPKKLEREFKAFQKDYLDQFSRRPDVPDLFFSDGNDVTVHASVTFRDERGESVCKSEVDPVKAGVLQDKGIRHILLRESVKNNLDEPKAVSEREVEVATRMIEESLSLRATSRYREVYHTVSLVRSKADFVVYTTATAMLICGTDVDGDVIVSSECPKLDTVKFIGRVRIGGMIVVEKENVMVQLDSNDVYVSGGVVTRVRRRS
jgi:hypothetical protein